MGGITLYRLTLDVIRRRTAGNIMLDQLCSKRILNFFFHYLS